MPDESIRPSAHRSADKKPRRHELAQGLPRWRRLRRSADFTRTERQGTRVQGTFVVVIARAGRGRVGFTVSRKVGGAVVRNAVKRRLRDVARRHKPLWAGTDLVVVARPEAAGRGLVALEEDFLGALRRLEEKRASHRSAPRETKQAPHPERGPRSKDDQARQGPRVSGEDDDEANR